MRTFICLAAVLMVGPAGTIQRAIAHPDQYTTFSRFTDPEGLSYLLDGLPDDIAGICAAAQQLTIHHMLLSYHGIPVSQWNRMTRIWPPSMPRLLSASQDGETHRLHTVRAPADRIVGGCLMESHFLAGLLRYRSIPVRVRAGFFKDIRANGAHVVRFWEDALRKKGMRATLQKELPAVWSVKTNAFTRWQNANNHYIHHWICEYWDRGSQQWRLLDADNTFLKAHSDIDVGVHLPREHFEYAHEAWAKMRTAANFNEYQYTEAPKDGRSHIRSQLLWDFFNLLNHDIAGAEDAKGQTARFISKRKYSDLTVLELNELDLLAHVLSQEPDTEDLVAYYRRASTLRLPSVENDPYSFVNTR